MKHLKRVGIVALVIVGALWVVVWIGWGPSLLAFEQEHALWTCGGGPFGSSAGIEWQGLPQRPGWICTTDSGTRYIGWWIW